MRLLKIDIKSSNKLESNTKIQLKNFIVLSEGNAFLRVEYWDFKSTIKATDYLNDFGYLYKSR